MVRVTLVVAALLLMGQPQVALAAMEPGEEAKIETKIESKQALKSDKARKVIVLLGALGVNSADAKSFVADIDSRMEDDTLNIFKDRVGTGTLKFHYRMGHGLDADNFELQYAPDNSNWKGVASRQGVMVLYQYKF